MLCKFEKKKYAKWATLKDKEILTPSFLEEITLTEHVSAGGYIGVKQGTEEKLTPYYFCI